MENLPHLIDSEDIIRGKIYRTAFPFLEERPLAFFEKCDVYNSACSLHCSGHQYCGRVVEKPYGFESSNDETLYVVTRFKARHAIVLSTSVLNENRSWPNVILAPIVGIHDDEIHKQKFKSIMNRDLSKFTTYYLDKDITGMHCYIDLGKIRPVPKNWLLQEKAFLEEEQAFNDISERIGLILAQRRLVDCKNCKKPCENCDIKGELEKLQLQLEKTGTETR
jgi:hypothetical protein